MWFLLFFNNPGSWPKRSLPLKATGHWDATPLWGWRHLLASIRLWVLLNYKGGHWKLSRSDHHCLEGYMSLVNSCRAGDLIFLTFSDPLTIWPFLSFSIISCRNHSSRLLTKSLPSLSTPPTHLSSCSWRGLSQIHLCPWVGVVTKRGFWDADRLLFLDLGCAHLVKIPEDVYLGFLPFSVYHMV